MSIHHKTALDRYSKDSFIKSSISNLQPISLEILIKCHDNGFKVIPISNDYRTPTIKSTNTIYDNPEYWTAEKLKNECNRFANLATTFGKTHLKDENGGALYLHGLDIDSDNVLRILFDLLEELKSKTFVTKTKKDCGYHIYWLSRKQNTPIGTSKCRQGFEFEIKTNNSLGLCALPPSRHRDDPNFRYQNIGQEKIIVDDTLYDRVLNLVKEECLVKSYPPNESDNHDCDGKSAKSNSIYRILQKDKIEQLVSDLKNSYQKGSRHDLVFGLGGLLFKHKISLPTAKRLISSLCESTHDEEKDSRLDILSDTYSKGLDGHKIKGTTQLREVLLRIHGRTEITDEILGKIFRALLADDLSNTREADDTHPSSTQILVQLARQNAVLFFKDQYGVAYGRIRVSRHTEILALKSTKFEYYLSKLYYDYTGGEIVGQESLNNANRVLIAETLFEGPTRELNLRVAWGERRGEEICYDLADPEWRCMRITNESWQIVNSDFPVMFARFNQKLQVLPDKNYPSQIFDNFLDLMHIQDSGHRLLTKVWIISLFIPEFPHPIGITYGEKGGSKSTFCRFVKRLVDPDKIELLTTPQEKAEYVQQLHHNYLAVYDNIKQLPPWFSDEACKAITGVGSSKRRLYSDDEDIIYDYKRCIMISGINNSLTEPDALDRSILTQFDRIPDEQRKEESEVEALFEEMRPQLFAYILDVLVKTLQIKPSIKLSNLPRMADFAVWGEAIARAMGYKRMEFVNAYYENIGKQNVEAIESNPLALAVEKFAHSWSKEGQEACWQSRNTSGRNKNTSTIRVWKEPPLPPPSPPSQNYAQNEDKISGGSLESGVTISTSLQISPGLDFEKVCRTGLSTWWAAIFDDMVSTGECEALTLPYYNRQKQEPSDLSYIGGSVLQPKKGFYHNLIVVDVASLYPSMAILHNISIDTINCECCKSLLESRISSDITNGCKIEKEYWICRQKEGAFPKKLRKFKEERLKQKKLGNNVKQLALKILINGGYGVFGNHYFKYYDPRVAELIAAYGRHTLSRMQNIATNMGFEIVYDDTDSLFIHYKSQDITGTTNGQEIVSKFQQECNKQLGIEVEHAKTYQKAIISNKKKHYIGWTSRDVKELDIVGMEGDKNDRPKWINTVFRQTAYDIFVGRNPLITLKGVILDLEAGNVNSDLLKRSSRLSKNPEEYENENDRKRKIGTAIGARKGDVIEYYESDSKEGYSLYPQEISNRKYKEMLWKAVKDILEIAGYEIAAIEQELIFENKDDHYGRPPRGVVGYAR